MILSLPFYLLCLKISEATSAFVDSYPMNAIQKQATVVLPTSWVCIREVSDFHRLHRELIPYASWIKVFGSISNEY